MTHERVKEVGVGFTATLVWPEVLFYRFDINMNRQDDHKEFQECMGQPEFRYDNWPTWRARVDGDESLLAAGCGALLAHYTDGMAFEDIEWVSPADLLKAVNILRELIAWQPESIALALSEYDDFSDTGRPVLALLLEDLDVIEQKVLWAQRLGKTKLAFEIQY